MNILILTIVLAIWLLAVTYVMPLSTLIAARPIEFGIVLAVFGLVGLTTFFEDGKEEEKLDLAGDAEENPDETSPTVVAPAGGRTQDPVAFPLPDTPLHDGVGG